MLRNRKRYKIFLFHLIQVLQRKPLELSNYLFFRNALHNTNLLFFLLPFYLQSASLHKGRRAGEKHPHILLIQIEATPESWICLVNKETLTACSSITLRYHEESCKQKQRQITKKGFFHFLSILYCLKALNPPPCKAGVISKKKAEPIFYPTPLPTVHQILYLNFKSGYLSLSRGGIRLSSTSNTTSPFAPF